MVKRWFAVGVTVLLVSLLVVGCGVPQEEHDAVLAEQDAAQAEVTSLQSDLDKAQGQIETLESDVTKAQSQIEALESDVAEAQNQIQSAQSSASAARSQLSSFKSDLNSLWTSLDKKQELAAYYIIYWAAAAVEDEESLGEMTLNMVSTVDAVGNAELSQVWQDAMSYAMEGKETEFMASFALLMIKTVELWGEDVEALDAKLSE